MDHKLKLGNLLRYLSNIPDVIYTRSNSSNSHYFRINNIIIRVSDHHSNRLSCDLYVMFVDNKYLVSISKNGIPLVFNSLPQIKNFINSYLQICNSLNKSALSHETEYMNTLNLKRTNLERRIEDLRSQITSIEASLSHFKVKKQEMISNMEGFITNLKQQESSSNTYPFILFLMENHNNRYQVLSAAQFPLIQKIYESVPPVVFISFINQLVMYSKDRRQVYIDNFAKENHVTLPST